MVKVGIAIHIIRHAYDSVDYRLTQWSIIVRTYGHNQHPIGIIVAPLLFCQCLLTITFDKNQSEC